MDPFTILSLLSGAATRLLPEITGYFKKKQEIVQQAQQNEHEKEMYGLQATHELAVLDKQTAISKIEADSKWVEQARVASQPVTGVTWVDALNALVRPTITFWLFGIFALARTLELLVATYSGVYAVWHSDHLTVLTVLTTAAQAISNAWGVDDQQLLAQIIGFWFLDRVIKKG